MGINQLSAQIQIRNNLIKITYGFFRRKKNNNLGGGND